MNKIVRQHYPAEKLPLELREGFAPDALVTITVEVETTPIDKMSLEELFALRRDVFASAEEVVEHIRTLRDEWER
jgi:hypothetical protein